jgi:hypothetical protein
MIRLANFQPFKIEEHTLTKHIAELERTAHLDAGRAQMLEKVTKALVDFREGVGAMRRMVQDRCKVRRGRPSNGGILTNRVQLWCSRYNERASFRGPRDLALRALAPLALVVCASSLWHSIVALSAAVH